MSRPVYERFEAEFLAGALEAPADLFAATVLRVPLADGRLDTEAFLGPGFPDALDGLAFIALDAGRLGLLVIQMPRSPPDLVVF